MFETHSRGMDALVLFLDVVLSAGLFVMLCTVPGLVPPSGGGTPLLILGLCAALTWPLGLRLCETPDATGEESMGRLAIDILLAGGLSGVVVGGVSLSSGVEVHPLLPVLLVGLQLGLLGFGRIIHFMLQRRARGAERNARHVMIAGSGPRAAYVDEVISRHPDWGLRVLGFVDDELPEDGPAVDPTRAFPMKAMEDLIRDQVIDAVIVAVPRSQLEKMVNAVDVARDAGVPITLLSDIFGDLLPAPRVTRFGTLPALSFAPVHHSRVGLGVKRAIDVAGAAVGLALVSPVLAVAAVAVKLSSPGPILFKQVRCTTNGRRFQMPKLRTMYVDAEERRQELLAQNEMDGPVFKIKDDPRITPVGRFLRRYSLDELPQLWSVLTGDMSLVGPRPPIPDEVATYATFERRRLSMRPGLTCLWQVSGRNRIGFDDWVRLDLEYIDNWSLAVDVRTLARTLPAVISGDGAS